jgi:hypothetical protein
MTWTLARRSRSIFGARPRGHSTINRSISEWFSVGGVLEQCEDPKLRKRKVLPEAAMDPEAEAQVSVRVGPPDIEALGVGEHRRTMVGAADREVRRPRAATAAASR